MSRIAVRLLLALCLVLNGIGNAMAVAAMPAMHVGLSDAAGVEASAEPQVVSACDHGAGVAAPVEELSIAATSPANHAGDCDEECCAKGACSCPCMQVVQATLLDTPAHPAASGRTPTAGSLSLGHPVPVPFNFIRPPIG